MRVTRFRKMFPRGADLDSVVVAYSSWRDECTAVRSAYRAWVRAAPGDAALAFACYRSAVDREERAADVYLKLVRRARRLPPEIGLAQQLADCTMLPQPGA